MLWLLAHGDCASWPLLQMTPIHPILVNFTAALVPVSFAAEVLGRVSKKPSLTGTAWWTLLAAAMVTPLTAAAGWYWKSQMDMPGMDSRQMTVHQWLGISLAILFIAVTAWRGQMFRRDRTPGYGYLAVLATLVGMLALQGHLGGVMSFADGDGNATDDASSAARAGMGMPNTTHPSSTSPARALVSPATTTSAAETERMSMPMPASNPASVPAAHADGWLDSIHVKGK